MFNSIFLIGLHILLLTMMCGFSNESLKEDSLLNFASGYHTLRRRHKRDIKKQNLRKRISTLHEDAAEA